MSRVAGSVTARDARFNAHRLAACSLRHHLAAAASAQRWPWRGETLSCFDSRDATIAG
jgi:hypothetical protein